MRGSEYNIKHDTDPATPLPDAYHGGVAFIFQTKEKAPPVLPTPTRLPGEPGGQYKSRTSYIVPPDPGKSNSPGIFMPKNRNKATKNRRYIMKKRADGRYQRKITLPDGTQKHVYGTSPAEVNRKAKEIERAFETGIDLSDRTTVAQWAIKWVQEYKSGLRENTQRSILRNLNLHILPVLGNMRMQDVKEVHCRAVMNPISKYSEDLQRKVLNILHQLFKTAIANGIVAKNPTENLEITPHAKPENQTQFLTTEQQRELLSRVTEPRARAFCALMLFCGLRREEALGVLWTDIEGNKLHVRRSLTFPVNQPDENRELKTTKANRAIPIPQRLKAILDETPKTALQIVPNAHGQEMTLSAFQRLWAHVEKSVSFHVYPYMLRHSYASTLYRLGVGVKQAQYLMGHKDVRTTLNIYTHLENSDLRDATEKLTALCL